MKKEYKRINLVGVELEGLWEPERLSLLKEGGFVLAHDGSVTVDGIASEPDGAYPCPSRSNVGEAVSKPMSPNDVPAWVEKHHPDRANTSCGTHLHISMGKLDYARLMDRDFYDEFMRQMKFWGDERGFSEESNFFTRLAGKRRYCQDVWDPDAQLAERGNRYSIWNFCAYKKHGTAECRVLPVFDTYVETTEALLFVNDFVEDYLETTDSETKVTISVKPRRVASYSGEGFPRVMLFDSEDGDEQEASADNFIADPAEARADVHPF